MASKHLKRALEKRAAEHKEDNAREIKQHGQIRPVEHQVSSKGWKSYSKIRYTSSAYLDGYSQIDWKK